MKSIAAAVLILSASVTVFGASPARADADDIKWIGQCVSDNKDEGQTVEVITKYCTCMNNKMSSDEKKSVTQWEKTHKTEMEACATTAGWKGK